MMVTENRYSTASFDSVGHVLIFSLVKGISFRDIHSVFIITNNSFQYKEKGQDICAVQ